MGKLYDVIILGAGPGGLAAGLYAGRARLSTLIIEKGQDGGQIAITDEIENYPGFMNISGFEFATKLYEQAAALGARIEFDRIVSIEGDATSGFTLKG